MVAIPTILTLLGLATTGYSTALTTLLTPNERLCFYADVDKAGEKIGVRPLYYLAAVFIHLQGSLPSSTSPFRVGAHSTSTSR
jgi:hypothetical protein